MSRHSMCLIVFAAMLVAFPASAVAKQATAHDLLLLQSGVGPNATTLLIQSGAARRSVPSGLYNPRSHMMYVASPAADGLHTTIRAIAVASGQTRHTLTLVGQFSTNPSNYASGTMSYDGRWLALRSSSSDAMGTEIALIDTKSMKLKSQPHLAGQFGLDALNADGTMLYLIEALPQRGAETYQVRSFNVKLSSLDPSPVLEKGETVGTMSGVAHTRVWSIGGDWLFTLYVRPGGAGAFIHSLGIGYRLAHCIFLPDQGVPAEQLAQYALALAPGGDVLYVVNPVLGRIAAVNNGGSGDLAFGSLTSISVGLTAPFQPSASSAVVSRDGRRLFVATGRGLWVVNTSSLKLRTTYLSGQATSSVALSSDGHHLYVLQPARHRLAMLDTKTGTLTSSMTVPASVSALEQVMR